MDRLWRPEFGIRLSNARALPARTNGEKQAIVNNRSSGKQHIESLRLCSPEARQASVDRNGWAQDSSIGQHIAVPRDHLVTGQQKIEVNPGDKTEHDLLSSPRCYSYRPAQYSDRKRVLFYCQTIGDSENACKLILKESPAVIGLDMEWTNQRGDRSGIPAPKSKISLLQIATDQSIVLIHLARFYDATRSEHLPASLRDILLNKMIKKVGVAIRADCTRLHQMTGVRTVNMIELSHIHKLIECCMSPQVEIPRLDKRLVSLATLFLTHTKMLIDKGEVRMSNWDRSLNEAQIDYAATDAAANLYLYQVLEQKRLRIKPVPPHPPSVEAEEPILDPTWAMVHWNALLMAAQERIHLGTAESGPNTTHKQANTAPTSRERDRLSTLMDRLVL